MPTHAETAVGRGPVRMSESPEPMFLATGIPDDRLDCLAAEHPSYALFAWARDQQDEWSLEAHRAWWIASIHLWPRQGGQVPISGRLAQAVVVLERHGLDHEAIESALGYEADSLRRMGVHRRLAATRLAYEGSVTDYVLPRVFTLADGEPDANAYPNFAPGELRLDRAADDVARTRRIEAVIKRCLMRSAV